MKFHLNPDNGAIGPCNAETPDKCPYSGDTDVVENHFDTIAEAREAYEAKMKDEQFRKLAKQTSLETFAESGTPEAEEYNQVNAEYEKAYAAWEEGDKYIKRNTKNRENYRFSEEWFNDVQKRKKLYFEQLKLKQQRRELLPRDVREMEDQEDQAEENKYKANKQAWFEKAKQEGYSVHPEVKEDNEWKVVNTIATYSSATPEFIKQRAADYMKSEGLTRTEAYRKVWADAPLRNDKPIVALDLEAAAPMIKGNVDMGSYSTIIEFGYSKRYPDGRVEEKSFLCGLPDDVRDTIGTGAEDVHNISPEMLKGLKPIQEDPEKIKEFVKDIDGSVIVAHSANYERSQLSHSIPGFSKALKEKRVEILDTREVSQWFMPQNESNTNEDFTTNNGVKYEGAHRALTDAKMSVQALFNLKGLKYE